NTDTASALTVNLSSSDTTEATVPATVTIGAGQVSATVNLAAVDDDLVDGTQTVTITASAPGFTSGSDTVQVTDNETPTLTDTKSFTNAVAITIPDSGAATPYPSVINVSGMGGTISSMTLTLRNLSHTWGNDIDALLVGPGGQAMRVMENAGTGPTANNANLT